MMSSCRPMWESGDWSSASSMSSAPSSTWASSSGWAPDASSSTTSWPTSMSSYPSGCPEISHWSDSEDDDDDEDGTAAEHEWDVCSIATDEIELETAEQLFISFMASMADLLKTQNPTQLPLPPQTFSPSSRPISYSHPPPLPPPRSPSPTPSTAEVSPDSPSRPFPHSVSMPLPITSPAPWHAPRGSTPPLQGLREEDFSVVLARMGDWEARHAAAVAAAVYRRHANLADLSGAPDLAGVAEDPATEDWVSEHSLRRQGVVGSLPLGLAMGDADSDVEVSIVGRGIAHAAQKRGLLGRLRKGWKR